MQDLYSVLIVDRNPIDRETYRQFLLQEGETHYTVLTAESGQQGLEKAMSLQPDLVLLGFDLPDLEEPEFLAQLRAQRVEDMPAVILLIEAESGTISARRLHQVTQAFKLGVQDCLTKGELSGELLQASVRQALAPLDLQRPRLQHCCTLVAPASGGASGGVSGDELSAIDCCNSRAMHRNLYENSTDCIKTLDLDGCLLSMNQAGVCLMQITNLNDVLGKSWKDFWTVNYHSTIEAAIATAKAGGVGHFYGECPTAQGTLKWWDVTVTATMNGTGKPQSLLVISRDVTQRKQQEDALRESHAQFVNTLESITDAFFSLDQAWRFTFVNLQAEKLLQKTQGDLLGRSIWEEFPEAVGSEFYQSYDRAVREQVSVQFEAFYPPLDTWFEVRAYPTQNGLAVYFQDVNARKAADAERERLLQQEQAARAQVEDLLRQLEAEQSRLEQILQQMPIGISISEAPSGRLLYHNQEAVRLLRHPLLASATYEGYAQYGGIHASGKPYQPEDYPIARSLLQGEVVKAEEMLYRRGDGTRTTFSVSAAPILDAHGANTAVVCAFEDISPLKQTEIRLRESEERLRLALEATGMGIWDWDVQTNRVTWAGNNEKLFGLPSGSFAGSYEAFLNCVHPDDRAAVQQATTEALNEKRGYTQEIRVVYPDGTIRWLSTHSELFLDDSGNPLRLIGTNQDITDAKQAQIALYESEARYRALAEMIPQFVWITSAAGQNEYVNRQFCEYVGKSEAELLNFGWLEIIHPDDREPTRERWLTAVHTGGFYEVEYRFRRVDGTYRWFLGQGQPLKNEQGEIVRWFGTCTDIHDQKQSEIERARLLAAAQAAHAEAETASRMKDEFLAIVSHELRSPLNAMLGWAKLLRSGQLKEEMREKAIEVIERNAKAQTQLIEDLLDISRIIRGKVRLELAPVNLPQVVEAAVDTVRPSATAKQLHLETHLNVPAAIVSGDLDRLQQVIWNLLSNAVKFTPEGGRVAVTLEQVKSDARITITDTGKGIAPDFLPYVFDRFRQAENVTTRATTGLGLGLAIVRNLVEMHGGTVCVESPGVGQGTTFTVELPLLAGMQAGKTPEASASLTFNQLSLAGVRVLVVDDELDTREFMIAVLEGSGATVTAAASASEAMPQFTAFQPDVLVSDIGMPNQDGYTFIQQVRSTLPAPTGQLPAVAITAFARQEDRSQALAAGFQMHVAKPIEPARLVSVVKTLAASKVTV